MIYISPEVHRLINTAIIGMVALTLFVYIYNNEHNIEECEARLFEKLTNQTAPTKEELHHDR